MSAEQPRSARTVAAQVTPRGEGGIATVLLAGHDARRILERWFRPIGSAPHAMPAAGAALLGRFGPAGAAIDEVVVSRCPDAGISGRSGEVALHCHGGRVMVRRILELLAADGVEIVTDMEYAALGREAAATSPVRVAALRALITARTRRAATMLLAQYNGALDRCFDAVARDLHSLTRAPADAAAGLQQLATAVEALLERGRLGSALVDGARVVIAGAPNAGKSSLFNAMLRVDRMITSERAGTTRDTIDCVLDCEGVPVTLVDTPGIDEFEDVVRARAVDRARGEVRDADLVLLTIDGSRPAAPADEAVLRWTESVPRLAVLTKSDLGPVDPASAALARSAAGGAAPLSVSARTGDGLAAVPAAVLQALGLDTAGSGGAGSGGAGSGGAGSGGAGSGGAGSGGAGSGGADAAVEEGVPFSASQIGALERLLPAVRALGVRLEKGGDLPSSAVSTLEAMLDAVRNADR